MNSYKAKEMKFSIILRFVILGALWLALSYMVVATAKPITLYTWFVVIASGIIIFAPMYKKYFGSKRK
ncbi:MAG: hypothetical protein IKV32_03695 [Muribaculaceae bacterium]|nr:hypothetical protein [Muribaculaceae bacterium]